MWRRDLYRKLTQTLNTGVGHHRGKVNNPTTHAVGTWLLFQELLHEVFRTKKNTTCIDTHLRIERILINLVNRLQVAGLATDAGIVDYTSRSSALIPLERSFDLHIEPSIGLNSLRHQSLPAVSLTNIGLWRIS